MSNSIRWNYHKLSAYFHDQLLISEKHFLFQKHLKLEYDQRYENFE